MSRKTTTTKKAATAATRKAARAAAKSEAALAAATGRPSTKQKAKKGRKAGRPVRMPEAASNATSPTTKSGMAPFGMASREALKNAAARYDKATRSCGDEIASALRELVSEATAGLVGDEASAAAGKVLVEVGAANDIDVLGRWGKRNLGMQRMNLGNCLRGRAKYGLRVEIGAFVIEAAK